MNLYTLFYFSAGDASVNLGRATDNKKFQIYVRNAVLLARSLDVKSTLTVLTNDAVRYKEILASCAFDMSVLKVEEIDFSLDVPREIGFFSAHFKIDAIRYISGLPGVKFPCVLVDSDVVFVGSGLDANVCQHCGFDIGVYDISEQVYPAYGQEIVQGDLMRVAGDFDVGANPGWYGGEFIFFCDASGASILCNMIDAIWPSYMACWREMHHQGDEIVVSAALNVLKISGCKVVDFGRFEKICRFWSGDVKHSQPGLLSLNNFEGLLHLPQDKKFLAVFLSVVSMIGYSNNVFVAFYIFFVKIKRAAIYFRSLLRLCIK